MRVKFLIPFAIFLLPFSLSGQIRYEINKVNSDSLKGVLPELKGIEKIDALNKIALASFSNYPDSCIKISKNTIALSKKIGYQKGLADGYFNKGNGYFIKDSIKQAMINYLKALNIYEKISPCIELGLTLNILAAINYHHAGRLEKATGYSKREIELYRQLSKPLHEIKAINKLAVGLMNYGLHDSAYHYLQKELELLSIHPDTNLLSIVYSNLSTNYAYQGPKEPEKENNILKQSIFWALKCLDLYNSYKDTHSIDMVWLPVLYTNLSFCYTSSDSQDSINEGLKYLSALKKMTESGDTIPPLFIIYVYNQYAYLQKRLHNDNDSAIKLYNKGLEKAKIRMSRLPIKYHNEIDPYFNLLVLKLEYRIRLRWVYNNLYRTFESMGDYKNALESFIQLEQADEEVFLEENKDLIAILEAESESEKNENMIAMLERDKHISDMQASQSRYFNIGLGILLIILILLSLLFIRQNKLRNEHKSTLLEQKLLRLQMNPHFIFNALSSIHSLMNPKDVNKASEYLGNFSRLLRTSLESSREDYILLEDEISSIRNYLELQRLRYDQKFDYSIEVDEKIDLENAIIPPMLIQPFIENAIEHGIRQKQDKGHIILRFHLVNKKIICEIDDDGVGREKAWETTYAKKSKHKSLATEIINDRIKILNKKFSQKIKLDIIDKRSETNQAMGTKVRLDLPYLLD